MIWSLSWRADPAGKVRSTNPGCSYRNAGFRRARCPEHVERIEDCAACNHRTKENGHLAFQMMPADMPEPEAPLGWQFSLFAGVA